MAVAERLAVLVPQALQALRPQALPVRRAEPGVRHEGMPGQHPEAPDRALPADAAVVAAAFN